VSVSDVIAMRSVVADSPRPSADTDLKNRPQRPDFNGWRTDWPPSRSGCCNARPDTGPTTSLASITWYAISPPSWLGARVYGRDAKAREAERGSSRSPLSLVLRCGETGKA